VCAGRLLLASFDALADARTQLDRKKCVLTARAKYEYKGRAEFASRSAGRGTAW
jgi:hypothetical protein